MRFFWSIFQIRTIVRFFCTLFDTYGYMVKNRREKILVKALELYLTRGYMNMTISDLQAALQMGRGTMYYYFQDKDELLRAVMKRYFIGPKQEMLKRIHSEPDMDVEGMIGELMKYFEFLESILPLFDNKIVNTSFVVSLMLTSYQLFPDLYRTANKLTAQERELWERAIHNSINKGIVRADVDVALTAHLFTNLKDAYDTGSSGTTMDFTIFPRSYNYLYELIKK